MPNQQPACQLKWQHCYREDSKQANKQTNNTNTTPKPEQKKI
jgi:hypothetical protein